MQKGLALGWLLDNSAHFLPNAAIYAAIQATNTKVVRFSFRLGTYGDSHNPADMANPTAWDAAICGAYQRAIDTLKSHGVTTIIGQLSNEIVPSAFVTNNPWNAGYTTYTPKFTASAPPPNAYIKAYLDAATKLVQTFTDITMWEIWNEPNGYGTDPTAWGTNTAILSDTKNHVHTFIFPQLFVYLLTKTASIVHSAHRQSMFGGILSEPYPANNPPPPTFPNAYADESGGAYLQAVRTLLPGSKLPCDLLGLHLYLQAATVQNRIDIIRKAMSRDLHDIYITEAGRDTPPPDPTKVPDVHAAQLKEEADQQAFLSAVFAACAKPKNAIRATCWFTVQDNPAGGIYHGLVRHHADNTLQPAMLKPAYASYLAIP